MHRKRRVWQLIWQLLAKQMFSVVSGILDVSVVIERHPGRPDGPLHAVTGRYRALRGVTSSTDSRIRHKRLCGLARGQRRPARVVTKTAPGVSNLLVPCGFRVDFPLTTDSWKAHSRVWFGGLPDRPCSRNAGAAATKATKLAAKPAVTGPRRSEGNMKTQKRSTLKTTLTSKQRDRLAQDPIGVLDGRGLRLVCMTQSRFAARGLAVDDEGGAFEFGPSGIAPLSPRRAVRRLVSLWNSAGCLTEPLPLRDWLGHVATLLPRQRPC